MVNVNLILAIGLLPLLLVPSAEMVWLVYLVAFAQSLVGQFFGPAENALLPNLVGEDQLLSANSLNALNNNLARLIGPALGGVVAISRGLSAVALIDAATFLVAALLIALIRQPKAEVSAEAPAAPANAFTAVWQEWLSGLRLVRQQHLVRILFAVLAITSMGEGVMSVLFVPFVADVLQGEALETARFHFSVTDQAGRGTK